MMSCRGPKGGMRAPVARLRQHARAILNPPMAGPRPQSRQLRCARPRARTPPRVGQNGSVATGATPTQTDVFDDVALDQECSGRARCTAPRRASMQLGMRNNHSRRLPARRRSHPTGAIMIAERRALAPARLASWPSRGLPRVLARNPQAAMVVRARSDPATRRCRR